jgi:hypothetical protein
MKTKSWVAYCRSFCWPLLAFVWLLAANSAYAQTTAFTYQGKLAVAGNPANNT